MKQGVCVEKRIVVASWVDGSIVNVVSNADASTQSIVYRRVKDFQVGYKAPTCVQEYNSAMQGVGRHDQLRGRFSLADGHSFQKWHKKLAMAMIDIARCNAYICDGLARGYHGDSNESTSTRDPHRTFVVSLIRELFNGEWKKSLENDCGMAYTVSATPETRPPNQSSSSAAATGFHYLPQTCVARESWKELEGRSRSKRKCTVCSFECRNATQKTDYCSAHQVALCKRSYPVDTGKPHLCQQETWTWWQKFHLFYLPKQVYTADGNLRRSSTIYQAQQPFLKSRREQQHNKKT